jgi:hypothetical protein
LLNCAPTGAAYYVYDESGRLLDEYDANGTPLYETIYMGLPVGVIKQTGTAAASDIATCLTGNGGIACFNPPKTHPSISTNTCLMWNTRIGFT